MMTFLVVLLIVLVIVGAGSAPWYPYSAQWGYAPASVVWVVAILLLIVILFNL